MKISRFLLAALLAAVLVPASHAQMMGGRTMGRGSYGMSDLQSMMSGGMGGMKAVVAPDGTVLVTRYKASTSTASLSSEVNAITPAGTVAWKWSPAQPPMSIEIAKNLVLVTTMPNSGFTRPPTGTADLKGTITALTLSSGSVAWTLQVDGVAMSVTPAETLIYALVMKPVFTSTSGGGMMGGGGMMNGGSMDVDTTLVAIGFDGHILWSAPLGD